ncbi:MAG TPA: hypothetical protein VFK38_01080 [Candidatus Limnocylindrales bacterium]|nr:hypothetical protein [Candidatus Limnocylindrales bacterium]
MAMVVLLLEGADPGLTLGSDTAERLARLGVTNVVLVRDDRGTGVVLEGWAFDPASAGDAVAEAIAPGGHIRLLEAVLQVAIAPAALTLAERT